MALVPYRASGAAADQRAAERLLQLPGGITLRLMQWPALSGAAAPQPGARYPDGSGDVLAAAASADPRCTSAGPVGKAAVEHKDTPPHGPPPTALANVGLVVWQAGFLLADFLLREAPECAPRRRAFGFGTEAPAAAAADWRSLTVVDLGTGSGVVGIALALAGAKVYLTDLPHVVPLAAANVAAHCDPRVHRACVCVYRWGEDPAASPAEPGAADGRVALDATRLSQTDATGADAAAARAAALTAPSPLTGVQPDILTAADVLYHEALLGPLMQALERLSAPHTVSYVSYRVRRGGEVAAFLSLAEAAGFAVEEVPDAALHEEYRRSGGGGTDGVRLGFGAGSEAASDTEEDPLGESAMAVERGGAGRWAPGTYGILRLCRRDCSQTGSAVATPPLPVAGASGGRLAA